MISLEDSFQRALLMCDDSLHLKEQAYELLTDKLADEDLYSFTVGLVERGIMVRHASHKVTDESVADKLVKAAQSYKQSPGGVWMPDGYEDEQELEDEDLEEVTDGEYESYLESTPFTFPNNQQETQPYTGTDVDELKAVLENAGLRITPEGTVEMYAANIPGIYTDKLPQGPLPLDIAVKYFDQLLDSSDSEQGRLDGLLDLLTRLNTQTSEIEASIEDLNNYNYSAASRSESSQAIANGLQEVRGLLAEGNWTAAQRVLEGLKGTIDQYSGERLDVYDENLAVIDALDKLADLQEADPQGYQQAIEGMGGIPMAAQRIADEDRDWQDAESLDFAVSPAYIERVLSDLPGNTSGVDLDVLTAGLQGVYYDANVTVSYAKTGQPFAEVYATFFGGNPTGEGWPRDIQQDQADIETDYDLLDSEDFAETIRDIVADVVDEV